MKPTRILAAAMTIALAAFGASVFAFHSGGVAECEGCHSMHEAASTDGNLLVRSDASSTCLNCHGAADTSPSSYHVLTTDAQYSGATSKMPANMSPGGDFGWLKVDFTFTYRDTNGDGTNDQETEDGQTHGHNIIAGDFSLTVDTDYATAPGGTFESANLGCNSCHDPHGKARMLYNGPGSYSPGGTNSGQPIYSSGSYGALPIANAYGGTGHKPQALAAPLGLAVGMYRLLWGPSSPDTPAGGADFNTYAIAVAPSTYNRSEATTQTRVAYGGAEGANSWGNWCGTCHTEFNKPSGDNMHHPTGNALGTGPLGAAVGSEATNYNGYVSSGELDGVASLAYSSLIPFAEATSDPAILVTHAGNDSNVLRTGGATGTSQVMCLSCHRAHASGFSYMLRFDYGYEFMTKYGNYVGSDNTLANSGSRFPAQHRGRTIAMWQRAYYERPAASWFGPFDRVMCNKCHAQD